MPLGDLRTQLLYPSAWPSLDLHMRHLCRLAACTGCNTILDQEGTLGHMPDEDLREMSRAHAIDLIHALLDKNLKVSLSKVAPSKHHLVVVSLRVSMLRCRSFISYNHGIRHH